MRIPSVSLARWDLASGNVSRADGYVGIQTSTPGGLLGLSRSDIFLTTDPSNNLVFSDPIAGSLTLSQLANIQAPDDFTVVNDLTVGGNIFNDALAAALDGYSNVNDSVITALQNAADGYALKATEDQRWSDSSQQRQDIRDSLDGYSNANDEVITALQNAADGYALAATEDQRWSDSAQQRQDLRNAADGYALAFVTTGAITVTIDPLDANKVGRPVVGTIFINQAAVTAFTGGNPFEFIMDFYDFLPSNIAHAITMNLSGTWHMPNGLNTSVAFDMTAKEYISGGALTIQGEADTAEWIEMHAGGTITSHQVASNNPFLTFAGSTFPNDGSLKGLWALTSDGQLLLIWDHDDATLNVIAVLSPVPTDGVTTATVIRPSTVIINSSDFSTRVASSANISIETKNVAAFVTMNDIRFDALNVGSFNMRLQEGLFFFSRLQVDGRDGYGTPDGLMFVPRPPSGRENLTFLINSSIPGTTGSGMDQALDVDGSMGAFGCYFQGGQNPAVFNDGESTRLTCSGTVFDNLASLGSDDGMVTFGEGAHFLPTIDNTFQTNGIRNKFINAPNGTAALFMNSGSVFETTFVPVVIEFANNSGDCVVLKDLVTMNLIDSVALTGFFDGGGNVGYGFNMSGFSGHLLLNTETTVTGALGDILIGAQSATYEELASTSILDLSTLNKVERE